MDIRTTGGPATADEMAAVDAVLGEPSSLWAGGERRPQDDHVARGGREARSRRHLLLPVLHAVQDRTGGVSRGALEYACRRLSIPPAEAFGVVSFYGRFTLDRPARVTLHVCDDLACQRAGAEEVCSAVARAGVHDAEWRRSPCLGLCDHAPAALVERAGDPPSERQLAPVTGDEAVAALRGEVDAPAHRLAGPKAGRLLRRVGSVDPSDLDAYRKHGGYEALARAFELGPDRVIKELLDARLLGRGGAAFPTGRKWESVARAAAKPHYLVCNADESETGTFKDRVLMEGDPFAVVEAMTIAAFATGCVKGYLYVRSEYPVARERIEDAIAAARAHRWLGHDIAGQGFDFDIEVRRGAGAYICGEETALFNSIEGRRGEPRNKPPFPVEAGLFGKPTLVNNVETLANVLPILVDGAAEFARLGTADSTGTRLFCVSGDVGRPDVYEVAMGTPLRELIERAGGVREGRTLQAVLLGGAAGSFIAPDRIDLPLSFEGTRAAGATLGSGAVIVFDDTADMKAVLLRIARFFRDESCGQCVPCRVGTVRQEEVLSRMFERNGADGHADVRLLTDIARAMRDASICGLGQTAPNAIASAITELKVLGDG